MSDSRGDDEGAASDERWLLPDDAHERLALQLGQKLSISRESGLHTEALMDCASMVSEVEGLEGAVNGASEDESRPSGGFSCQELHPNTASAAHASGSLIP